MSFEEIAQPTAMTPSEPPAQGEPVSGQPAVEKETKDPYADNFARLVRRERQIKERESKLSDYEKKLSDYQSREALAKEDPMLFLEKHGLSIDDITKRLLDDPTPPERKELLELKQKMAKWEEEKAAEAKRKEEETQESAYQQAQRELKDLLEKDPDKYELVRMQNAHDLVFQVVYEYQRTHGKWLSFEEAAGKVESHLEKQVESLLESKKIKSRFAPKTDDSPRDSQGTQFGDAHGAPSPTLSNLNANQSTPRPDGRVSDEELMKRALAVMKNG